MNRGPAGIFLGREQELAAINAAMADRASRAIVLAGAMGVGKTHLAGLFWPGLRATGASPCGWV